MRDPKVDICKRVIIAGLVSFAWAIPAFAGLDVYAGPLGKFYKNEYLSTQAQTAKELGIEFNTVYPDGEPEWLTDKNVDRKIRAFRVSVSKQTKDSSPDMASWNEETNDYLIEQLNWDSLAALIHVSAYVFRPDLERPKDFSGEYTEYPAYTEASEKGYYLGPIAILESDMFLPSKGKDFIFQDTPLKGEILITSTDNLKRTLNFLNKRLWKGQATPQIWIDRGPAKVGKVQEMRISEETGKPEMVEVEYPPLADVALYDAEYAYGVLYKMLKYSEEHNVPIAMDG